MQTTSSPNQLPLRKDVHPQQPSRVVRADEPIHDSKTVLAMAASLASNVCASVSSFRKLASTAEHIVLGDNEPKPQPSSKASASPPSIFDVQVFKDVPYGLRTDASHELIALDVYSPVATMTSTSTSTSTSFPCIIWVHGGAFCFGSKDADNSASVSLHLSRQGFVVMSVDYALSTLSNGGATKILLIITAIMTLIGSFGKHAHDYLIVVSIWFSLCCVIVLILLHRKPHRYYHPDMAYEVATAVRWTKEHATSYGGLSNSITLAGHSAGAHLVALLSTHTQYLDAVGMSTAELTSVVCVSGIYNHFSLRETIAQRLLLDEVFGTDELRMIDAFPIHNISPQTCPPVFILNADYDMTLKRHALEFRSCLRSTGVYVENQVYDQTNHFSIILQWSNRNAAVLSDVVDFVRRCHEAKVAQARFNQ